VAVREHIQHVLGLSDAEVITGLPRSMPPPTGPSAIGPHSMSVVAERSSSRVSMLGDEFKAEELFSREQTPPLRASKNEPGRL
jgi:hypothetical protein